MAAFGMKSIDPNGIFEGAKLPLLGLSPRSANSSSMDVLIEALEEIRTAVLYFSGLDSNPLECFITARRTGAWHTSGTKAVHERCA
jgi:hypothetical protein